MLRSILRIAVIMGLVVLAISCQKKVTRVQTENNALLSSESGKIVSLIVNRENVRREPNGKVIGRLRKGEKITIIRRVGNWIQFKSPKYKNAYIWAPSIGYDYINIYSPFFYFDSSRAAFRPIAYFQNIFSQKGQIREETSAEYQLFFKEIGLGSHEATVLEVVTESHQIVDHGITLYIDRKKGKIYQIRVDFFKPAKGYARALRKCELPVKKPVIENNGHVIWPAGTLVKNLTVDLERKEWNSTWFTSVWYKTEQAAEIGN